MMYENDKESIIKAQQGDKLELENLIKYNNRAYMEHSKTLQWKRI